MRIKLGDYKDSKFTATLSSLCQERQDSRHIQNGLIDEAHLAVMEILFMDRCN